MALDIGSTKLLPAGYVVSPNNEIAYQVWTISSFPRPCVVHSQHLLNQIPIRIPHVNTSDGALSPSPRYNLAPF